MLQSLRTLVDSGNDELDTYPLYRKTLWDLMCKLFKEKESFLLFVSERLGGSFGVDTVKEKEETDELLYTLDRFFFDTEDKDYLALKGLQMFPMFDVGKPYTHKFYFIT